MADHDATVVREAGMYWVRCTACGLVAKSQTQKAVMQARADAHNGGAAQTQPSAKKLDVDKAIKRSRAEQAISSPAAQAPVLLGGKSQALRTNVCQGCGGPLKANDGHMHETPYPTKFVCCDCRVQTIAKGHVLWCKAKEAV